jgi:hypothetical protein
MSTYEITLRFKATRLLPRHLAWAVRLLADPAAPEGLTFHIRRVRDTPEPPDA